MAECEVAGMRIRTSKSEAMVLSRKPVDCLLWVGNVSLPQVKEFKYLWVLFMSEGMMGHEINRRVLAAGAVLHVLHHTIVTKRELSWKVKPSIFVPTLTRAPPWGGVPGTPTGKRPRGRPRTRWRDYISSLAW